MAQIFTEREDAMCAVNRRFYDPLWAWADLVRPERFNTWPLVQELTAGSHRRLEVGPGLRPRLPLDKGTSFVDLSDEAVAKLREGGADAVQGVIGNLPYADGEFDVVCALDIVEHVENDEAALSELARVAAPGARLLISVPLHPGRWQPFDDVVGHRRRYIPGAFFARLEEHGFVIERSAEYGMQPSYPRLVEFGMRMLEWHRSHAMWIYNRIFMPLGLMCQGSLVLRDGVGDPMKVDQLMLVCRKVGDDISG